MEKSEINGKAFVHYQSWREAYVGLVNQAFLDDRTLEMSQERTLRAFENGVSTFIAKDGEQVVGFADYGRYRGDDLIDTGEVYAIYVLKDYYDKGVGYALISKAMEAMMENKEIAVWVREGNARAIHFYERCGFRFDGQKQVITLGNPISELRMILKR